MWCCTKSCHRSLCACLCGRTYDKVGEGEGGKKAYDKAKRGAATFWIDLFYVFILAGWLVYGSTRVYHHYKNFSIETITDDTHKDLVKECMNFYRPAAMIIVGVGKSNNLILKDLHQ